MAEDKKWEGRTQVGPYQLEEQLPQDPGTPGELYLATHEETGATALVLKPATGEDAAPIPGFQVQFTASQEEDYLALEVKDTRRARAPDKHSADVLMPLLEDVHEGVGRMARALDNPEDPPPPGRMGLALAGTVALWALLFVLVPLASGSAPPGGPASLARTPPAIESHEFHEDMAGTPDEPSGGMWISDIVDAGNEDGGIESVVARPLPREALKGQKRPPCHRYAEVELVGGCWIEAALKAPCPDVLYEHEGKCYAPILSAKPPPQSVEP